MTTLHRNSSNGRTKKQKLSRLVKERRDLVSRLGKLEGKIAKLGPTGGKRKKVSPAELERILDELSSGPPMSKSLPEDFSRADIYDDHD